MPDAPDSVRRALARLTAVRTTVVGLQGRFYVTEQYVNEFHAALDELTAAGHDISSFRVPDEHFERRSHQTSYVTGARSHDSFRSTEQAYLLMKVDAVLGYFSLADEPSRAIGFQGPDRA